MNKRQQGLRTRSMIRICRWIKKKILFRFNWKHQTMCCTHDHNLKRLTKTFVTHLLKSHLNRIIGHSRMSFLRTLLKKWSVYWLAAIRAEVLKKARKYFAVCSKRKRLSFRKEIFWHYSHRRDLALYILDKAIKFLANRFLTRIPTKQSWDMFLQFWCLLYTKIWKWFLVDQKTSFEGLVIVYELLCSVKLSQTADKSRRRPGLAWALMSVNTCLLRDVS